MDDTFKTRYGKQAKPPPINKNNVSSSDVKRKQQDSRKQEREAEQKATIFLEKKKVFVPKPKDYDTDLDFFDALREYHRKHTYFYIEILNGRMELR